MTQAHDEGAERGEVYLRLMAEACLRRARAYPPYHPPAPPGLPGPVAFALRAAGPAVLALGRAARPLTPVTGQAARVLRPWGSRAAGMLMPFAWRVMRAARGLPHRPGRDEPPPALEDVGRVRMVAGALVAAGVVGEATADSILSGLTAGLALRSRLGPGALYAAHLPFPRGRPGTAPGSAPPTGPVVAAPVGVAVPAGPTGPAGQGSGERTWHLLAVVLTPGEVILTMAARDAREGRERRRGPGPFWADGPPDVTATDDRGTTCRLDLDEASGDREWAFASFHASPPPPAGTRWLDIAVRPGADTVRVDLPASSGPQTAPVPSGPQTAPATDSAPAPGEWVLDDNAETLLWQQILYTGRDRDGPPDGLAALPEIVTALEAAGALPPGSPAVARLATLAGRLGIGMPRDLHRHVPVELPEPWEGVLAERARRDGPTGTVPAAATLPAIGGSRFVLAGLHSSAESATLHVMAWGWEPRPGVLRGNSLRSTWHARDDAGRWHIMGMTTFNQCNGNRHLGLTMVPPIHPAATALEVIVTSRDDQARVTVPLRWREVTG